MGYFSELDLTRKTEYVDRSYHGFDEQLLWRYEDLKDRYRELLDMDAPISGDDYFTTDDCRYAPVQCFETIYDIWHAMEIAKEDLEEKCNIIVREDGIIENKDNEEENPNQITVFEIVLLPTWIQTAVAA